MKPPSSYMPAKNAIVTNAPPRSLEALEEHGPLVLIGQGDPMESCSGSGTGNDLFDATYPVLIEEVNTDPSAGNGSRITPRLRRNEGG